MITEVIVTYPEPSINIGGSPQKRWAHIKFSVCIDSTELTYESMQLDGVNLKDWKIEDLEFLTDVFNKIKGLEGKTLSEVVNE